MTRNYSIHLSKEYVSNYYCMKQQLIKELKIQEENGSKIKGAIWFEFNEPTYGQMVNK